MSPWKERIPGCFFPTTALVIDDSASFLESLNTALASSLTHKDFRDPQAALDYLTKRYQPVLQPSRWVKTLNKDQVELDTLALHAHSYLDIDFSLIHPIVYNPNRFEEISTVVSDYAMPTMNGVDVFRQLTGHPFQKLLLTGVASGSTAIDAFNAHLINLFIPKQAPKLSEFRTMLNESIETLHRQYFLNLTSELMRTLTLDPRSVIGEPAFLEIFNRIIEENKIVEYYLVNESGCFLMLDFDANPSWLVFKAEEDMAYYYISALENDAPQPIIDALEKREKVLFLFSKDDDEGISYAQWNDYLFNAAHLDGTKNRFYYTYIPGKSVYDLKTESITSFRTFLDSFE